MSEQIKYEQKEPKYYAIKEEVLVKAIQSIADASHQKPFNEIAALIDQLKASPLLQLKEDQKHVSPAQENGGEVKAEGEAK